MVSLVIGRKLFLIIVISRRKPCFRVGGQFLDMMEICICIKKVLVSLEMGFPHELLDLTRCLVLTSLAVSPPNKQIIVSQSFFPAGSVFCRIQRFLSELTKRSQGCLFPWAECEILPN